ncbi:acetyl-CoA carboxylase carboxyltransferase subunit alpha [Saccharothrix algeriensis]|uniref:Multifunctional fusion protein n=1 Tax=Saccharothrix algeriensis TaxID=173560 RepID=A0A8T8I1K3_9PSEU|nr:acetyl-CoA carboxylase carboxyltransferase subunit alpha [Saccharothrix algeriensis]MBM7810370.1 acetyl-CoA carboxylase carboxyl transferase subunit beta [Saccharothrix algeriensis]QTR04508.1 acetyl-CoA carboxylase carboxyltransferase subunit alpha [Saccharothrix algeriensis]
MVVPQRGRETLARLAALPEDAWTSCRGCRAVLHGSRLRRTAGVCPECGHHGRLGARERIAQLADPGTFTEHHADTAAGDPLEFTDRLAYPERVARARKDTGLTEAAVVGIAELGGRPAVLAVLDFAFLGGSMGSVVGEKIAYAAELAATRRVPLIAVSSSGGARMQEGILSLLQMAKTAAAIGRLRAAGVPFISVLADPVYGGVSASFAALGDVVLAETGTRAGFAGRQVIEQTLREALPKRFQTAEFLHEHGHLDLVLNRGELQLVLRDIVAFHAAAGTRPGPAEPFPATRIAARATDPWEAVRLARHTGRPNALGYVERVFNRFTPLHGDRWSGDDEAVIGGLAWLDDAPVVVIGHCKGRDTPENVRRNFGMPHPHGYRKAMRLMTLAERFGVPVVTLVDTPGAYPGRKAEEDNQSGAIAEALVLSAGLRVPIVTVVTGEGGSGGALALATGDRLLMQENAVYSVISPEGCATILFGDAGKAPEAARALRLSAPEVYRLGVADELVPEPAGGAHTDPAAAADAVADALRRALGELVRTDPDELVAARYRRLRAYGSATLPGPDAARRTGEPPTAAERSPIVESAHA